MENKITELVFIIDKSGSMHGLEEDTIGGFNSMIEKQKNGEGECLVSTVFFNQNSTVIHDRVDIAKVEPLTDASYCVGGSTALIDAIGDAIHHIGNVHKYARKEDVPGKTMFVIITDGLENCSRKYSSAKVKKMVENEKEKYGWEFVFIGANIDSVETARTYGIDEDRAMNYVHDKVGTEMVYKSVCEAVRCVRGRAPISDECFSAVNADYDARENRFKRKKKS